MQHCEILEQRHFLKAILLQQSKRWVQWAPPQQLRRWAASTLSSMNVSVSPLCAEAHDRHQKVKDHLEM
jgi:hypothetical protein